MTDPITAELLDAATEKQLVAGRKLWNLALPAARAGAKARKTISYTEAAAETGYAPVGIGRALDALAAYCARENVPDLSSLYRPTTSGSGRWASNEDREAAADACYAHRGWKRLKA